MIGLSGGYIEEIPEYPYSVKQIHGLLNGIIYLVIMPIGVYFARYRRCTIFIFSFYF